MIGRDHQIGGNVWFLAETSSGVVLHGQLRAIAGITAVIQHGETLAKRAVRDCYETEGEALFVRAEQLTTEIALRQQALNSTLQRLVILSNSFAPCTCDCKTGPCCAS